MVTPDYPMGQTWDRSRVVLVRHARITESEMVSRASTICSTRRCRREVLLAAGGHRLIWTTGAVLLVSGESYREIHRDQIHRDQIRDVNHGESPCKSGRAVRRCANLVGECGSVASATIPADSCGGKTHQRRHFFCSLGGA